MKFSSNENPSPTVPAASLCQNHRAARERWTDVLSEINYVALLVKQKNNNDNACQLLFLLKSIFINLFTISSFFLIILQ